MHVQKVGMVSNVQQQRLFVILKILINYVVVMALVCQVEQHLAIHVYANRAGNPNKMIRHVRWMLMNVKRLIHHVQLNR